MKKYIIWPCSFQRKCLVKFEENLDVDLLCKKNLTHLNGKNFWFWRKKYPPPTKKSYSWYLTLGNSPVILSMPRVGDFVVLRDENDCPLLSISISLCILSDSLSISRLSSSRLSRLLLCDEVDLKIKKRL